MSLSVKCIYVMWKVLDHRLSTLLIVKGVNECQVVFCKQLVATSTWVFVLLLCLAGNVILINQSTEKIPLSVELK